MFLLTFSFANFEMTRGSRGKANVNYLCYKSGSYIAWWAWWVTAQKCFSSIFNIEMKKRGETLFGECILAVSFRILTFSQFPNCCGPWYPSLQLKVIFRKCVDQTSSVNFWFCFTNLNYTIFLKTLGSPKSFILKCFVYVWLGWDISSI